MAAVKNRRKLAARNLKNYEEHHKSKLQQISNVLRRQEEYISQVFEEIEGRVTEKLSQEISWTKSRISGALSRVDEFLLKLPSQGQSGSAPETSRNALGTNQATSEADSQSDPYPEASDS